MGCRFPGLRSWTGFEFRLAMGNLVFPAGICATLEAAGCGDFRWQTFVPPVRPFRANPGWGASYHKGTPSKASCGGEADGGGRGLLAVPDTWIEIMRCCFFLKPCGSIFSATDHNRLSHYHPRRGDTNELQDRESRSHFPTKETLRLLAGFGLTNPNAAMPAGARRRSKGFTYAS